MVAAAGTYNSPTNTISPFTLLLPLIHAESEICIKMHKKNPPKTKKTILSELIFMEMQNSSFKIRKISISDDVLFFKVAYNQVI